jgi:hypothetical protein
VLRIGISLWIMMRHPIIFPLYLLGAVAGTAATINLSFEDAGLATGTYLNEAPAGGFAGSAAVLSNSFTDWGGGFTSWSGFALSSLAGATISPDDMAQSLFYGYQYHAAAGAAAGGSVFAVAYTGFPDDAIISFSQHALTAGGVRPLSVAISNSLYTWASMTYGDLFAKQFGGASGDDPDFLLLTITGRDAAQQVTGTVEFLLADFRSADPASRYILDHWVSVDLAPLGSGVLSMEFTLASSDMGAWGMNTPAYFAMDMLTVAVPEPAAAAGILALAAALMLWRGRRRAV